MTDNRSEAEIYITESFADQIRKMLVRSSPLWVDLVLIGNARFLRSRQVWAERQRDRCYGRSQVRASRQQLRASPKVFLPSWIEEIDV